LDDMGADMLTRKKSAFASSIFIPWAMVTVSLALLLSPSPEALFSAVVIGLVLVFSVGGTLAFLVMKARGLL